MSSPAFLSPARVVLSLAVTALALAQPPGAAAQEPRTGTLSLRVVEDSTGRPVDRARVRIPGVRFPAFTDARGYVRVSGVPEGSRVLKVSRLGYVAAEKLVDFAAGATAEASITLAPEAYRLAGVTGTAAPQDARLAREGFYRRRHGALGTFMTAEQIFDMRPLRTTDIFRQMLGFTVRQGPGGPYVTTSRGGRLDIGRNGLQPAPCVPALLLNGVQVGRGFEAAQILEAVAPEDILGIEAYSSSAGVPPQYAARGICGAILVWTK